MQKLPDLKAETTKCFEQKEFVSSPCASTFPSSLSLRGSRYGGSGVLFRDAPLALKKQDSTSFTGKAMLRMLRARLAPVRPHAFDADNGDPKSKKSVFNAEAAKPGGLSKIFKLWNKDYGVGQSRTKKKLATVCAICSSSRGVLV
jgi:hypothetical protein